MTANYADFLVSRIFESNHFGSWEQLKQAIEVADRIDPSVYWRKRKDTFNQLSILAPMRNTIGVGLKYEEVVKYIDDECKAFYKTKFKDVSNDICIQALEHVRPIIETPSGRSMGEFAAALQLIDKALIRNI